jgi:hypothetical protein
MVQRLSKAHQELETYDGIRSNGISIDTSASKIYMD